MSKLARTVTLLFAAFLLILQFLNVSNAQEVDASINIDATAATAEVTGRFANGGAVRKRNFFFVKFAGGAADLGERITNVQLSRADGSAVNFRKLIPGEFLAEDDFVSYRYSVSLAPPKNQGAAAHVSWMDADKGLLMLDDLLPQTTIGANVNVKLPDGWQSFSPDSAGGAGSYRFADASKAVIFIGKRLKSSKVQAGGVAIELVTSGEWLFTDAEAIAMAAEIYAEYRKIFGSGHAGVAQINIVRFPGQVSPGNWQAETRGRNLTIVSSDMNFRTQSLQRLHEQLRHELFHLWLPNAVNLTGKYDWFYEGFALYQSLKTAVAMNRIRFDDFLDTLSRAYSIDSRQTRRMSLIDASKSRFAGNDTQIYARGMLVAFLADLSILEQSKGRSSVSTFLGELFSKHRSPNAAVDGTEAVIASMRRSNINEAIIVKYVLGSGPFAWNNEISAAGIEPPDAGAKTGLTVRPKPTGRQKALLDKLGYNNWRKLSSSKK